MTDVDRSRPGQLAVRQRQALAAYIAGEVHPFSSVERPRLDAAGLGPRGVRGLDDLRRLPPTDLADVDGLDAVLRPTAAGLGRSSLRWKWLSARVGRRQAKFVDEVVEPRYRAVHFDDHDGIVVASSATDLDRLAGVGRRMLELAGVQPTDAVVSVLPAGPDLAFWQVTLGCRRGGVPALHLGAAASGDDVAGYAPTVLVGRPDALAAVAAGGADLDSVRLVLAAGEALDADRRDDLAARFPRAAIRAAWAPAGVRALWAECKGGELHTWPDIEVVEIVDDVTGESLPPGRPGMVVWTPIGWRGTVVLRLRTGVRAKVLDGNCPTCGRTTPRLRLMPLMPPAPWLDDLDDALGAVLDDDPLIAGWFAEHYEGAPGEAPELVVRVAPVRGSRVALEAVLDSLGADLGASRLLVERPTRVRDRVEAAGGRRVVGIGRDR